MKYRKKIVEVEAVQFTRNNWDEVVKFTDGRAERMTTERCPNGKCHCYVMGHEGELITMEGDYIIKKIDGEIYPCPSGIFQKTYEAVE